MNEKHNEKIDRKLYIVIAWVQTGLQLDPRGIPLANSTKKFNDRIPKDTSFNTQIHSVCTCNVRNQRSEDFKTLYRKCN